MKYQRLIVQVQDRAFTLGEFAKIYGFSYATAYRYYQAGFRDQRLLDKLLALKYGGFELVGKKFKTKTECAKYLGISVPTLNKYLKAGRIDRLEELAKQ